VVTGVPDPCDRSRILREWLPTEDDMTPAQWTPADWAAFNANAGPVVARAVHDLLWAQVTEPTKDAANPVPRQPNLGKLLSSDYNHDGVTLAGVSALKAAMAVLLPADHPLAARLTTDVPLSVDDIAGLTDPAALAQLGDAVTERLVQLATSAGKE
jgi:hypothetical protein